MNAGLIESPDDEPRARWQPPGGCSAAMDISLSWPRFPGGSHMRCTAAPANSSRIPAHIDGKLECGARMTRNIRTRVALTRMDGARNNEDCDNTDDPILVRSPA